MAKTQIDGDLISNNSLTGDDVREESLDPQKILFANEAFSSDNIHDAIVESKTFGNNFSYHEIPPGLQVRVEQHQQMIVYDGLKISGELVIKGSIILR